MVDRLRTLSLASFAFLLVVGVGACNTDSVVDAGSDAGSASGSNEENDSRCGPDEEPHPVTGECRSVPSPGDDPPSSGEGDAGETGSDASAGLDSSVPTGDDTSTGSDTSSTGRDGTSNGRDGSSGGRDGSSGGRDGFADTSSDVRRSNDVRRRDSAGRDTRGSSDTHPTDGGGRDVPASCPDRDGDGFKAESCGGRDCYDKNALVNPSMSERCSQLDNDCDGQTNEGLTCTFFAHGPDQVVEIDPFAKTTTPLSSTNSPDSSMYDMDTHPNGTLYVITQAAKIWKYDSNASKWKKVGDTQISDTPANGLAINRGGTAFVTAQSGMYKVDLQTANATKLSGLGRFDSSGDCVVTEGNILLMAATGASGDQLVRVDQQSGQPTKLGTLNHDRVWGLTAAWGELFGMTDGGTLITIDVNNGTSRTLTSFSGSSWYGAASTPASRRPSP